MSELELLAPGNGTSSGYGTADKWLEQAMEKKGMKGKKLYVSAPGLSSSLFRRSHVPC